MVTLIVIYKMCLRQNMDIDTKKIFQYLYLCDTGHSIFLLSVSILILQYISDINTCYYILVKFGHSEKNTIFEKIFYLKFDTTELNFM